jgi:hypothetical protein
MMEGVNSSMIYLIHKNFCKCHNVPPLSTTMIKEKEKKTTSLKKKRDKASLTI